jgi:hypothetical protein
VSRQVDCSGRTHLPHPISQLGPDRVTTGRDPLGPGQFKVNRKCAARQQDHMRGVDPQQHRLPQLQQAYGRDIEGQAIAVAVI